MLHFFISSHHHRLTLLKVVTTVKERYDSFVYVMSFTHSFDTYLLGVYKSTLKKVNVPLLFYNIGFMSPRVIKWLILDSTLTERENWLL